MSFYLYTLDMKIIVTTDTHWGFTIIGDQANITMLNKIKDEKKDALLHCGDWGSTSFADRYNYWKLVRSTLGKDLPIGTIMGNHDWWAGQFFRLYATPISPYEVYLQNMDILKEFDIVPLFDEMELQEEGGKTLFIKGFDGWYRDDVRTNDQNYIPGFRPLGIEWLQKRSHNQFGDCIKSIGEAKDKGNITMLVTHFGFIEEDAKNDWKARSSAMDTFGRAMEPQYFGNNLKYEDFLDKVDYMCYGHSHSPFSGVAKNGTTKILNVGSDYEMPEYQILEV